MVFKPFTHLARQTFSKTFAHGYAQSVVAASQSYATSTPLNQLTSLHGKYTRTAQLQNAFQSSSSGSSSAGPKAGHAASNHSGGDSGLAAYYAAWQHAQQTGDDGDWKQFQFKRRIGWKPTSKDAKDESKDSEGQNDHSLSNSSADSARETQEMKDIRNVEVNADVSAKVDEAVSHEIQQMKDAEEDLDSSSASYSPESLETTKDAASSEVTPESSVQDSSEVTSVTPDQSKTTEKSSPEFDRVISLAEDGQYNQVPASFESLLKDGFVPSATAYNALLESALALYADVHNSVPKALDIYSDMLRRGVMPNKKTYSILLQLLTSRALVTIKSIESLEQKRKRFGGMDEPGKFIFRSSEAEHELLVEDHSLSIALKLFTAAMSRHADITFPLEVYGALVTACAKSGDVEQMIQIFAHLETHKIAPHASMFPPMIDAFAAAGDLKSAVECYNEYKALAIADDSGVFGIVGRKDGEVYAAVVKAYLDCGKRDGGLRFMDKIRSSFDEVKDREHRMQIVENVIVKDGIVQYAISTGKFADALKEARTHLRQDCLISAVSEICAAAADAGDVAVSTEAYDILSPESPGLLNAAVAMLALHIRQGNLVSAKTFWGVLISSDHATAEIIHPTAMYSVALLKNGQIEEGLMQARTMFTRIRKSVDGHKGQANLREEIDEAIDLLGRVLMQSSSMIPTHAAMTLIWTMVENGGLVSPVAEHAIASLGPMGISQLSVQDLTLALQVQAGMLVNNSSLLDIAHPIRFAHMLEVAFTSGLPMETFRSRLLEEGILQLGEVRPDLVQRWQAYVQTPVTPTYVAPQYSPASVRPASTKPSRPDEAFDPHSHSTDYRGSSIIAEELENSNGRAETHLDEALVKFRNMRRIGRHPRYITYAKLITAAAKCGRMNLVHEILAMARRDVPLMPQYGVVKYGWTSILDAMVAACLTSGDRSLAAKYHQELLTIGASPSANTFGLYITTLKESTKTFDEATEAVKIFHRAVSEGVEPTSFLYNALIGKLGKARRIDDCLLYFAEMRANGVRPTSVTYGTVVNALCRVSDERFAEEMFDEMESMPNYKPRPAPYNSLIQYFLNTKRDRSKVLAYYDRMQTRNIKPTMHTYKLLMDAYASLEPVNMDAAEKLLEKIRSTGQQPEAVHYASLIHAKGCVLHDMPAARKVFNEVISNKHIRPQPCIYQALFEAMVANHQVAATEDLVEDMARRNVEMTPYIANTLIHGWATEGNIAKSKSIYDGIGVGKREPSTYEAMTRAFLSSDDRQRASEVVQEMLTRGYPSAVSSKVVELIGGGSTPNPTVAVA